ncbi:hypothetical protein EXN66_Car005776 [Channa argus]|uniref:Uncharacterized protein n=1 Tax=Channa argus TaxID=215402 RepID=A0A6G1PIZ1_CHAAH|nr:hypothetical protein EXN66_Car005776 [Channa argus]
MAQGLEPTYRIISVLDRGEYWKETIVQYRALVSKSVNMTGRKQSCPPHTVTSCCSKVPHPGLDEADDYPFHPAPGLLKFIEVTRKTVSNCDSCAAAGATRLVPPFLPLVKVKLDYLKCVPPILYITNICIMSVPQQLETPQDYVIKRSFSSLGDCMMSSTGALQKQVDHDFKLHSALIATSVVVKLQNAYKAVHAQTVCCMYIEYDMQQDSFTYSTNNTSE